MDGFCQGCQPVNVWPWARSIQPKFRPVRPGKVVHLKRWTSFFGTIPEILVEWIAPLDSSGRSVISWSYWFDSGGVRTGIAKHHGRYSKSDHLCQDGEEWTSRRKRLQRRIFVKYAVEISDLPLFSSTDVCKNKGYRIIGGKQCLSVNKCNLFEITRMQSVNRRIAALFYASVASVMKVLKVRPGVRL